MKITIIGAGLLGVTSAYFLSKAGHEVEVIDREEGPALQTSFANAGMLTPSMSDPWNSPGILTTLLTTLGRSDSSFLLRPKALPSLIFWGLSFLYNSRKNIYLKNLHRSADLACYSMNVMEELQDELNIQYQYITTGSMKVFRDQKSMDKVAKLSKELAQHDMGFQILPRDEIANVEPSLKPVLHKLCGAIYFPDDRAGDAYEFSCEMAKAATANGAVFRYGIEVEKLLKDGSKITGIKTNQGEIKVDNIILCAASYSAALARSVGLNVPVRPAKGYSISVPLNGYEGGPSMPLIDDGFHAAITPLGNILRVAGTAEFAGLDQSLNRQRLDNLYNLLNEIYPDFAPHLEREKVSEWSGLRPLMPDGSPLIGKTSIDNLYLNTGHGPLGWTMAAGSAKMLSNIIDGEKTPLDPMVYKLGRA